MLARVKLKGIDGRTHKAWKVRLNLTQRGETYQVQTPGRIDRLRALSRFCGWWCMAVLSWWSDLSG